MIEPILIVGIVIAATAWYVQHKWRKRLRAMAAMRDAARNTSGLELLARRYAQGEIDRDEYLEKRDDILAAPAVARSRP
ncbi:MAG TPA: SHOCT domain-containing protein [Xanthobacteraceae bacterium]|nr:SHOCT domain-containing protein [Xanthobacteraceae bacterium]